MSVSEQQIDVRQECLQFEKLQIDSSTKSLSNISSQHNCRSSAEQSGCSPQRSSQSSFSPGGHRARRSLQPRLPPGLKEEGASALIPEGGLLKCCRSGDTGDLFIKIEYSREQLALYSKSPLSKQRVANFREIVLNLPELVRAPPQAVSDYGSIISMLGSGSPMSPCVDPSTALQSPRRGPILPINEGSPLLAHIHNKDEMTVSSAELALQEHMSLGS